MAFDQLKWNDYACTVRCLLELVRRKQERVIEPERFVASHLDKYPAWAEVPGLANTMVTCELAKELGLGNVAKTYLDPDKIAKESKLAGYVGTLIFTERMPNKDDPERLDLVYHTMLGLDLSNWRHFTVWDPLPDGSAREDNPLSWKRWYQWKMHGLILSQFHMG